MTSAEDRPEPVEPVEPFERAEPAEASGLDVARLYERVERVLLDGPRKYTPEQVSAQAGVSRAESHGLWRALGFATVGDDDAVYTDSDVDALTLVQQLQACGFDDEELIAAMTRLFGQTFSRLASWQGQLLLEMFAERPDLLESEDSVVDIVEHITPIMEQLQNYAWRRQLVSFFGRVAARASTDVTASPLSASLAVGFVDMSGFTALTRRSTEGELRELLDTFESRATDIVGAHGGRIVKTIGDEILFQAEDPASAAEIALGLLESAERDERLPDLRAGVAFGPVVSRLGDVYGSTVNIGSRLTSISRPGWVLVDRAMRDALQDDPRFHLRSRRPESVRGYHHLHPWRLRRAER